MKYEPVSTSLSQDSRSFVYVGASNDRFLKSEAEWAESNLNKIVDANFELDIIMKANRWSRVTGTWLRWSSPFLILFYVLAMVLYPSAMSKDSSNFYAFLTSFVIASCAAVIFLWALFKGSNAMSRAVLIKSAASVQGGLSHAKQMILTSPSAKKWFLDNVFESRPLLVGDLVVMKFLQENDFSSPIDSQLVDESFSAEWLKVAPVHL